MSGIRERLRALPSDSANRIAELPGRICEITMQRVNADPRDIAVFWHAPDGERWVLISGDCPLAYRLEPPETLKQVVRLLESDDPWAEGGLSADRDCVGFVFGWKVPSFSA
jgi:hypothetical protein